MDIRDLQRNWDNFGEKDPMWAILTHADKKDGLWDLEEFLQTGRVEIDRLFRMLQRLEITLPPGRALDFGCGIGRLTQALARYMPEVAGVDIAPSMIAQAQSINRFGDKVTYHLNQRNDLSLFPSGSFALIYSNITLQHMRPRYARVYLQEFVRLLQPGGVLVFQLPSRRRDATPAGWLYRFAAWIDHDRGAAWVQRFSRRWHKGGSEPVMEMYGTTPEQVRAWLQDLPVRFVQVRENKGAGNDWEGFRYVLMKQ